MYLNCHSYYSLRYGTFSEVTLLDLAQENGLQQLALTDINSTSACLNFIKEAQERQMHAVVGVDIRNGIDQQYVMLARNNEGYQEINEFLTEHLHQKKHFSETAPAFKNCYTIYPFEKAMGLKFDRFRESEYIGVAIRDLNKLPFSPLAGLRDKMVILKTVSFRNKADYNAHRLLRTIDLNTLLSKLPVQEQGDPEDKMIAPEVLRIKYQDYPKLLFNTDRLLKSCKVNFYFDDHRVNQNQIIYGESKEDDARMLEELCYSKIKMRYKNPSLEVYERVEKELTAIKQMDFVSYFLINHDILEYARSQNYPHIGRGSGANSVVAYIIGITNVDPIELDLYFERFINVFRSSPPDFDIDFSSFERDDVTAYIFRRFKNTALMGTYVTFQYRAVIRELGKVFGVPKFEIDNHLKGYKRKQSQSSDYIDLIDKYAHYIHGFPNYLSVHSGGIIITQKPIAYYTSTFMPPKGFQTVQFDMNIAEEVGIFKFDILAQRGLSKIKDCIEIIKYNQPDVTLPDMEDVEQFKNDPEINRLLNTGDCMGVFYVESPAMRTLMTKLQTNDYLNLVAASSIIRPGVSNGGMKNEFILRHRIPEKRKEAHPVMLEVLHDTYGVMVYQEDVLKVAHKFAGLSLAESDILRRGMRGKVKSKGQFEQIEKKFKSNCLERGYTEQLTLEVWDQIKAFAGYAFAKGHSASYAVESYQSLYLKKYFPLEFMTAVLNNGGGFYNIETYVHEIKVQGGIVAAPCINNSEHGNRIIGKTVYLGMGMLKTLSMRAVQTILNNRNFNGHYKSFDDFLERVNVGLEQLIILIRIDAFRFTGVDKHVLLWEAHLKLENKLPQHSDPVLFSPKKVNYDIPEITSEAVIDAYDQIELLSFPLCTYFELLNAPLPTDFKAVELHNHINKQIAICGKLVTAKGTPTKDKRLMHFGTFLDIDGTFFDTVHFPIISEKYNIQSNGVYYIKGKVVDDLGCVAIIVDFIERLHIIPDPRFTDVDRNVKLM
ncbi:PHP domain-containing protein [uncultured Dokdonia sp.]|uniref:DNA polymerase III subunit alpha n=1 Tax=uncultured Dokdonia sp. TaxID=575653 RepID=UPI0030EBC534|tara:strand:+ start:12265 stop:15252 length:2988 start_codon:yes stop_codon:yes gene_type:complete